jgi:hypothetical protein
VRTVHVVRNARSVAVLGTPADTCRMAKKPEPPSQLTAWSVYKIAAKAVRLGTVEAADEANAIEKGAVEFKVPANRLLVVRR